MFDNIAILRAIDERQRQQDGRPWHMHALHLLNEMCGTFSADTKLFPGFLQELLIARSAGYLTWRISGREPNRNDPNDYLQQIQDLALTPAGQDRARGQVVVQPLPDPDEDDGHQLSDLILRQVADSITFQLDLVQAAMLLGEEGLPPDWLGEMHGEPAPDPAVPGGVRNTLAFTWHAGGWEGRRLVRQFLGRWIGQQLFTGPDADEQADLITKLARQGWQLRESDSVLVAAPRLRGMPMPAAPMHEWRPHPLVEAVARPQFAIKQPDQAVFASFREVEIRVRKLGQFPADVVGVELMNKAFGPTGPLTDPASPRGEQEGTRSLFGGAMGVLRNSTGHRQVDLCMAEAVEGVAIASHLMRILDAAEDRLLAAAAQLAAAP
jgi:uncharacterized protein (TIGR02391 family)